MMQEKSNSQISRENIFKPIGKLATIAIGTAFGLGLSKGAVADDVEKVTKKVYLDVTIDEKEVHCLFIVLIIARIY